MLKRNLFHWSEKKTNSDGVANFQSFFSTKAIGTYAGNGTSFGYLSILFYLSEGAFAPKRNHLLEI